MVRLYRFGKSSNRGFLLRFLGIKSPTNLQFKDNFFCFAWVILVAFLRIRLYFFDFIKAFMKCFF
jgi:hypothetical protein